MHGLTQCVVRATENSLSTLPSEQPPPSVLEASGYGQLCSSKDAMVRFGRPVL